ncbi:glycoside hydrolase family 30 protein [Silvibacterium sp.]|uniref:glycoside hydrolase family 30 protein n=1 Tax=Silvibacterium sp. TaxID=1964179 RepID=UPI0039E6E166
MRFRPAILPALLLLALPSFSFAGSSDATEWLTTADRSSLLAKQPGLLEFHKEKDSKLPVIDVDDSKKFQSMDGFGFALTGGSAQLLMKMSAPQRGELLRELFGRGDNEVGVNYIRVSIGSSDMNDHAFTYDDLKDGDTDPKLEKFNLGPDADTVVPVLKEILAINPELKILGSPWSAPAWMKTNGKLKDGSLKPEYYGAYAAYFVKYIDAMRAQGIRIDAITVQNEPLNPHNTPSMVMQAEDQAKFIATALGPAFEKAKLKTKIIVYDHNCDKPEYPMTILKDPAAAKYVDGSAFHLYEGDISAMTKVHDAYPKKNLYFTEQMTIDEKGESQLAIARSVSRLIVGAPRNWARNVLLWNLAADPELGPHTNDGGCPICEGAITIDGDAITRNIAYYTVAQASKFVPTGSVRIGSNEPDSLPNVAFKVEGGREVVIVANTSKDEQKFAIRDHGKAITTSLPAGAVATYVW